MSGNTRRDPLQHCPPEVLSEIFSYLLPHDIRNCVKVNRSWRDRAPALSTKPWRYHSVYADDSIDQRPPHADCIEILTMYTCPRVSDWLFRLASSGCNNVKTLWLTLCKTSHDPRFVEALKSMSTLHTLVFIEHLSSVPYGTILAACPQLRTIHYEMDWQMCMDWTRVYNGALEIPSGVTFESLMCLSLDTVTDKNVVRGLLQRSPNIRCVRLGNSMGNHYNIVDPILSLEAADLSMIVDTCPDVEYIECNRSEDTKNDEDTFVVLLEDVWWWKTYVSRSLSLLPPSRGLRVLKFFGVHGNEASEQYDFDNVIKVLRRSQDSLGTLHLAKCKLQGLDSLHMQKLEKLVCKTNICQDITQLAMFIKQSPQLNRLELNVAMKGLDNDTLIKTLAKHPSLKTLVFHMRHTDSRARSSTPDLRSVCRLLRALGSHNDCNVENIAFGGLLTEFGLTNGLLDAAASIPSLRGIRLHGERSYGGMMVPMVYDDFIPSSGDEGWDSNGHYYMDEDDKHDSDTDNYEENGPINDGLKRFLRSIERHHITRLELLDISLSKTTFTLLGEMDFLNELTIANCGSIPNTNLQKLLPGRSYDGPLSKLTIVQSELNYGEDGIDVRFIQKKGFRTVQTPAEQDDGIWRFVR